MDANRSQISPQALGAVLALLFALSLGWLIFNNARAGAEPLQVIFSAVLLAVPLSLLYYSIGLFVLSGQQRRARGRIAPDMARALYITPRLAGLIIVLFVSMFALDAFQEGAGAWAMLLAFLLHALPAIVMAVLLVFAWRWEWIGFVAFAGAAVFFLVFFYRDPAQALGNFLIFSAPMAAVGLLFWANWKWKDSLIASGP